VVSDLLKEAVIGEMELDSGDLYDLQAFHGFPEVGGVCLGQLVCPGGWRDEVDPVV